MRTLRAVTGPLVALIVLTACGGGVPTPSAATSTGTGTESGATHPVRLAPAAFATAMAEPGTVTLDVHVPFAGRLGADDLMIPFDEIPAHLAELPADHATRLAVYCRSGTMSASAVRELADLGYSDVVELAGGMDAWVADGRTLITTP